MKAQRIPWAGPLRVHRASNPQGISQTCKILKKKQCGGTRGLWVSAPRPKLVPGEGTPNKTQRHTQHELMTSTKKKKSHEGPKNSMGWPLASAQSLKSARNLTNMQN